MGQVEARPGRREVAPPAGRMHKRAVGSGGQRDGGLVCRRLDRKTAGVAVHGPCAPDSAPGLSAPPDEWGGWWPTGSRGAHASEGQCKNPEDQMPALLCSPRQQRHLSRTQSKSGWETPRVWQELGRRGWPGAGGAVGTEGRGETEVAEARDRCGGLNGGQGRGGIQGDLDFEFGATE